MIHRDYPASFTGIVAISADSSLSAFSASLRRSSKLHLNETGNVTDLSGSASHIKVTKEHLRMRSCVKIAIVTPLGEETAMARSYISASLNESGAGSGSRFRI
jgi:hypothetical protein